MSRICPTRAATAGSGVLLRPTPPGDCIFSSVFQHDHNKPQRKTTTKRLTEKKGETRKKKKKNRPRRLTSTKLWQEGRKEHKHRGMKLSGHQCIASARRALRVVSQRRAVHVAPWKRSLHGCQHRHAPVCEHWSISVPQQRRSFHRSPLGHNDGDASPTLVSPTIYALSTAPGRAAIAIVRISGPACLQVNINHEPYNTNINKSILRTNQPIMTT